MKKEEVLKKLELQINQLNNQFQIVKNQSNKIPKLEIDRMLSDIRATYELFTVLNYLNIYGENTAISSVNQEKENETVLKKENSEIINTENIDLKTIEIKKSNPTIQSKNQTENEKTTGKENSKEILADKFRQHKIDDLKKVIPLHEKFLYINELFMGENELYNQFIEKINKETEPENIEKYLAELTLQYKWDTESKTFLKLQEIIRRRF